MRIIYIPFFENSVTLWCILQNGETVVHYASYEGDKDLIQTLIDAGAALNVKNKVMIYRNKIYPYVKSNQGVTNYTSGKTLRIISYFQKVI